MNEPKTFESSGLAAGGGGMRGIFADPLSLATKPAVIFKFASAVSRMSVYLAINAWRLLIYGQPRAAIN